MTEQGADSPDSSPRGGSYGLPSYHDERVEGQRARLVKFSANTKLIGAYLDTQIRQVIQSINSVDKWAKQYKLTDNTEEYYLYSNVSQSNIAGFSRLCKATAKLANNETIFCRVINLNNFVGALALRLNFSFAIGKFFGDRKSTSPHFLAIYDIFCVFKEPNKTIYMFEERFTLEHSLSHHVFNGTITAPMAKLVITELAKAVEYLNIHGVAHRFIRPENVLAILPKDNNNKPVVKLTSFDMAWLYWDAVENCSISSPKKGLPIEVEPNLLDHLPPEAFEDKYDCSMVDVWSVATLACILLARDNPFLVDGEQPFVKVQQWKDFASRLFVPDEMRSLLDDIFVQADSRMTIGDLAKDKRLELATETFIRQKLPRYYRIDLPKKINLTKPEIGSSGSLSLGSLSADNFISTCNDVCECASFKRVQSEENITEYQIVRAKSFEEDLSPQVIVNDRYLKAAKGDIELEEAVGTEKHCLVKIIQQSCVPLRHFHQILGESSKIMNYMSSTEPYSHYTHRVLDIFLVRQDLYIFYENLYQHQSINQIVTAQLVSDQVLSAGSRQTSPQQLSLPNVQKWTHQLYQTVHYLASNGLSHRYIRPEFVFIAPDTGDIKLTHFELACFGWNARTLLLVPRRKAIQDELAHQWNHLPPECYELQYNCLLVDVWSVAVLVTFCFTGQTPFEVPLAESSVQSQWQQFKQSNKAQASLMKFPQMVTILDLVFVSAERRLPASTLMNKFTPASVKLADEPNEPKHKKKKKTPSIAPPIKKPKSAENLTRNLESNTRISQGNQKSNQKTNQKSIQKSNQKSVRKDRSNSKTTQVQAKTGKRSKDSHGNRSGKSKSKTSQKGNNNK